MIQHLINLKKLNSDKENRLIPAIIAIGTLLATTFFPISVFNIIPVQAQPANTDLTSGEIYLIGQVDVRKLPEASGIASNNHVIIPAFHRDEQQFAKEKALAESPGFVPPGQSGKVIVSPSTAPLTVGVNLNPEGVSGDSSFCSCSPPDPNLGVGQNQVFEMVNLAGIIYNKDGTLAKNTFPLSGFFQLSSTSPMSISDPQIIYDNGSHRWFASIVDIFNKRVLFAVSTSEDPTGTWNLYATRKSSNLPDQPFIGVSDDKFVISANDYKGFAGPYAGVQYWIFNKSELVAGKSTVNFSTNKPNPAYFSVHPANHLGTSSGLFYMITVGIGTTNTATLFTVSGIPTATTTPTVTTNSFSIKTMSIPPGALQPGTTTTMNTNDNRVLSAVWQNNNLWFSANDACIPNGDATARSCARLINITTSGTSPPTKVQDFDYASSGQYFFYPAVSLSQSQLVVVYGLSSFTVYPSLLATGQAPSDGINTLQTPATIRSGSQPDTSTRYGDYFGAATDPNPTASSTFWVAGEYRINSGFQSWSTAIAQVGALV